MIETSGRKGKTTRHRMLQRTTRYLARASMKAARSAFVAGQRVWRGISRPKIVAAALQRYGLARRIECAWRRAGTALGIHQPTPAQRWLTLPESSLVCGSSWMWRVPSNRLNANTATRRKGSVDHTAKSSLNRHQQLPRSGIVEGKRLAAVQRNILRRGFHRDSRYQNAFPATPKAQSTAGASVRK